MAENILKLRVDSQEYDNKLKRAAEGIQRYAEGCRKAGGTLEHLDEGVEQFVKELGKMETTSKSAKGSLNEMTKSFVDLSMQYKQLTDQEKAAPFGKALSASLDQLRGRILQTKTDLEDINRQINEVSQTGGSKMQGVLGAVVGGRGGMVGNIAAQLGATKTQLIGISAAVAGVGAAFKLVGDNVSTAMNFEKSMSGLSALTGMVGDDLERLKEYAIELGGTTTLTASQVADAFRLIGSQQPQLLESGEALKEVTKYAIQLSEAAGIDLITASQTLSTSINQMGGDSNNAARYVNVLAAASQKGAGDIAWLGEAITKAATAAKAVGTDYEELVANLEQLAKAGFDASTAGTALRSIIMNLEKQANDEFKPSIVGLTQAFENLGRANLSIVEYQQIAGKMFASQAMALANAAGEARNMTAAITDTNVATEQATTNTANLDGSLKSLSSAWEALNLHINSSNGLLKDAVDWFKEIVQWADQSFTAAGRAQKRLAELKDEQNTSGGKSTGNTKVDRQIGTLSRASADRREGIYNQEVQNYWRYINAWQNKLKEAEGRKDLWAWETIKKEKDIAEARNKIDGAKELLKEYQQRAKSYITQPATTDTKGGKAVVDVSVDVDGDGSGMKTIKQLQEELKKLKKLRDDAASAGKTALRDQYNTQIKDVNAQIKALRGGSTTTTTHQTPQQRAQESFTKAEQNYKQALEQAAMELEAGTITRAEAKKKEMQAAEQRWKAIGDARNINDSPELKQAQDEAAANYKALAAEVKTATERQKAIDKATRDLENANQKLATARSEMAQAKQQGDLQAYNTAKGKATAAQKEITRLEKVKVDVERGKVDLPQVPKEVEMEVKPITYTIGNLDAFISNLKQQLSTADVGSELYNNLTAQLADATTLGNLIETAIKNGIDIAQFDPQALWRKIFGDTPGDYIRNEEWQKKFGTVSQKTGKKIQFNPQTGEVREDKKKEDGLAEFSKDFSAITGSVNGILSGIQNLGIEIPEGLAKTIGVIQTISGILTAILTITTAIQATSSADATASWLNAIIPFARGGIVPHAANGYYVPGNHYSGDVTPILANAGELVLSRSQQNALAGQLQGSGIAGMQLSAVITGEQLRLVLNNNGRRTGRGEVVTTNFR